jgi:osmotically-inducible protein OsmY
MIMNGRNFTHHNVAPKLLKSALALTFASCLVGCAHTMAYLSGPGVTDENPGSRTVGMVVEDTNIETKVAGNLYKADNRFRDRPIKVASYNGIVLLAGNVADDGMANTAVGIAKKMRGVRNVHSELTIGPAQNWQSTGNDAWIHSKITTIMYATRDFPASRIKVVTEGGVVYLMGLVSEREADEAVEIIKDISGIKRIVKIFEYIPQKNQGMAY